MSAFVAISYAVDSRELWLVKSIRSYDREWFFETFNKPYANSNQISLHVYSRKGLVTTQELVDEFGITPRTIQRDLNVLAYNDLVHSPSRGKWETTRKKVKITS